MSSSFIPLFFLQTSSETLASFCNIIIQWRSSLAEQYALVADVAIWTII